MVGRSQTRASQLKAIELCSFPLLLIAALDFVESKSAAMGLQKRFALTSIGFP